MSPEESYRYQFACLIIEAYERQAILSETREGAMVMALSPLMGCRLGLESTERLLIRTLDPVPEREAQEPDPLTREDPEAAQAVACDAGHQDPQADQPLIPEEAGRIPGQTVFSADLSELLGLDQTLFGSDLTLGDYLRECFGCDLRMNFSFQLKPIDLLGPIRDLMDQIESALDMFEQHLDPFGQLQDFCHLLNSLRPMCLPDLIAMLVSLKMLLKKYATSGLDMRVDWTTVLGPLIKFIVDLFVSMVQLIDQVIGGIYDCLVGPLEIGAQALDAAKGLVNTTVALGESLADTFTGIPKGSIPGFGVKDSAQAFTKTVSYEGSEVEQLSDLTSQYPKFPSLGGVETQVGQTPPGAQGGSLTIPAGFAYSAQDTFDERIQDPAWKGANPITKVLLAFKDSRNFLRSMNDNLLHAFKSLNGFFGGGIRLQLKNAGAILSILDLISLVTLAIRMIRATGSEDPRDWCRYLEQHPDLLEEYLKIQFPDARVELGDTRRLTLREGPFEGYVDAGCGSEPNPNLRWQVERWIADLERQMGE